MEKLSFLRVYVGNISYRKLLVVKGYIMNKVKCYITVFCFLCFANVFANSTDFKDELSAFRQAVEDYATARKDNRKQLNENAAKYMMKITETARKDSQARTLLINEIADLGNKYMADSNSTPKIPMKDKVYYDLLVGILRNVDGERFLSYARDVSKSKYINYRFKEKCFDEVIGMRIATYIKAPESLKDFDLVMIEICSNFLDPSNGTKSCYGLMGLRRRFVSHLLGYEIEIGKLSLPAADRTLGMKLAKEVIQREDYPFIAGKDWFMEQSAKYDPDIHQQYLDELRKYADDEHTPNKSRLRYAKKLLELNKELVEQLEQKAKDEERSREGGG